MMETNASKSSVLVSMVMIGGQQKSAVPHWRKLEAHFTRLAISQKKCPEHRRPGNFPNVIQANNKLSFLLTPPP